LKACLDDMVMDNDVSSQFVDSDSEGEDGAKPKKSIKGTVEPSDVSAFKSSLLFKGAKGTNSGLFYVNYNEVKGGLGLDRDEKNQLASNIAIGESKYQALQDSVKTIYLTTTKLQSEPLNSQLSTLLVNGASDSSKLQGQLELARTFTTNEKEKEQNKKRIDYYSSIWRKRRKLCIEFLTSMEELTDGTVTAKSCLSGHGPIDIDSDEAITKLALDIAQKKRTRVLTSKTYGSSTKSNTTKPPFQASENFVAVSLDSQGMVRRVYL
jgi:hypothetical protein